MYINRENVLQVCKSGIQDKSDVMVIAQYLDHPDTDQDDVYQIAYSAMQAFIEKSSDPAHEQHPLFLDTHWRSYEMGNIVGQINYELW